MDLLNKSLDRIEKNLRTLIEDYLVHLIAGKQSQQSLIDQFIQEMRDNLHRKPEGSILAPDHFIIHVPPEDFIEWQVNQEILDRIALTLNEIGLDEGFQFQQKVKIELHVKSALGKKQFEISSSISQTQVPPIDTAAMENPDLATGIADIPENASFIIGGSTTFSLEKPVLNIGRHSTNDLVLADPHVSRHHAQIRAIDRHFVIFDVGSSSGVLLNGKPVTQATLQSGDVIRIGVVNLIYLQDSTSANPTTVIPINSNDYIDGDDAE